MLATTRYSMPLDKSLDGLVSFLERCSVAFEWWNASKDSDEDLTHYFEQRAGNVDLAIVVDKVRRLDKEYATHITAYISHEDMARHILGVRFPDPQTHLDEQLKKGDPECVNKIGGLSCEETRTHGSVLLLSFAAKYCHFSNPMVYPIYDSHACAAVKRLNSRLHFTKSWPVDYSDMGDDAYFIWMGDIDALRRSFVPAWSLKRLDQALWYLGALLPDSKVDSVSRSCMLHRVRPIPSILGIREDEEGWPCLQGTQTS